MTFGGTATLTSDYTHSATSITISAGSATGSITLSVINDVLDEADETVMVSLGTLENASQGTNNSVTVTILDDDAPSTLSLPTSSFNVSEDVGVITVVVSLDKPSSFPIDVNFAFSGSVTTSGAKADVSAPAKVTIPAGETSVQLFVTVLNDAVDEADEELEISIQSSTFSAIAPGVLKVVILDDDTPEAKPDSYQVSEGNVLSVSKELGVLINDVNNLENTICAIEATNPAHGTLAFNADGSFVYTHDGSETTSDVFRYKASDGKLESGFTTVTITINPVNDLPVANDDSYGVEEGGELSISAPGVLANDVDAENNTLSAVLIAQPEHGVLSLYSDGSFVYRHDGSETTTDFFTYRVYDGSDYGNVASVSIAINPVNDAPVANDDVYELNQGASLSVNKDNGVLSNDEDVDSSVLTVELVDDVANGTLTLNSDGSFDYQHDNSVDYSVSFTYRVSDGALYSQTAEVILNILGVNHPPVALSDHYSVGEGAVLLVDATHGVLANDSDADGDVFTSVLTQDVKFGSLTRYDDGSFTYTHDGSENHADSFKYRPTDGKHSGNEVVVNIAVNPVNDVPVGVVDAYSLSEGNSLTVSAENGVMTNDSDAELDVMTVTVGKKPEHGELTLALDGSFTYTHDGSENHSDVFTYIISDDTDVCAPVVVTLSIDPVNDAPVAGDDTFFTLENVKLIENVLGNDLDAEKDAISVDPVLVNNANFGTVSMSANGEFTYTPNAGFSGSDSFIYKACDGNGGCDEATVNINVTLVNQAPVVTPMVVETDEDTPASGSLLPMVSDRERDALTFNTTLVTAPQYGTLTLSANGDYTYTPNDNYHGADAFAFEVCDTEPLCTSATVSIQVHSVNDVPNAVNDQFATKEGEAVSGNVLSNDVDVDEDV
ncbi:VCBS repeat-containing protein, partial [Breznakibacter xylanolyticus]